MLLGFVMILVTPLNRRIIFTGNIDETKKESGMIFKMLRIPTISLTALIIIITAISWSFLEPTLEPHLRKVFPFFINKIIEYSNIKFIEDI